MQEKDATKMSPCPDMGKCGYLGRQIVAEFFECDTGVLNDVKAIEKYMVDAAIECGATVVEKCFHEFNPYGVSGVVVISESHLAVHTWPEFGYAAVDLFTCGENCSPRVAYEYLLRAFKCKSGSYSEFRRGMLNPGNNSEVLKRPYEVVSSPMQPIQC